VIAPEPPLPVENAKGGSATADLTAPAPDVHAGFVAGSTIVIDSRYLRHPGVGIGQYLAHTVREIYETGCTLTLLTDDADHGESLVEAFPNSEVIVLPTISGFRWEQWSLMKFLYRRRPDVFIAPANWGLPLCYVGSTCLVVVVHDLIPIRMAREYLLRDAKWTLKYLASTGIAALRSDWVIANSRATASDVRRLWRKRRVATVYPPQVAAVARASVRKPLAPLGRRSGYFLYTGGFDPRKNVEVMVEAFNLLRRSGDTRRLIVTGTHAYAVKPLVESLSLGESVVFTGHVSNEVRDDLVSHADALVYPSRMEGLGLPVVEALSFVTPVVCGPLPPIIEVAGGLPHYADVNNARSLADAMESAGTPEARDRLAAALPSHLKELSRQKATHGIVLILEEILQNRRT
jgi:glycosyltransferase involved in cell wall biosynthesis